ncbi:hypothetical protein QJS66_12495 [Kocuria rhizophila]|nr:hypothetical protein QJS66_12495 [Kocuria rhizophila]
MIAEDAVLLRAGLVRLSRTPGTRWWPRRHAEGLVKAVAERGLALVDVRLPPSFRARSPPC